MREGSAGARTGVGARYIQQLPERGSDGLRAAPTLLQSGSGCTLAPVRRTGAQRRPELLDAHQDCGLELAPRELALLRTKCRIGSREGLLERHEPLRLAARLQALGPKLCAQIADQQLDLTAAGAEPEELAGKIGQLMSFIENHGIDAWQQIPEPILLERQIGEQQVVVDHDDVGFQRRATRLEYMTG